MLAGTLLYLLFIYFLVSFRFRNRHRLVLCTGMIQFESASVSLDVALKHN